MTKVDGALLVIDMQAGLVEGDDPLHDAEGLLTRIGALITRARAIGAAVIYVLDDDVGPMGGPEWALHPAIAPLPEEPQIHKAACDAFHETGLHQALLERDIKHLVVVGAKTQFCIDTTCRQAITRGYPVVLVEDGHSTTDSESLPAPAIIQHHNNTLHEFGAYVAEQPCELLVRPGEAIRFQSALDVPSSGEVLIESGSRSSIY